MAATNKKHTRGYDDTCDVCRHKDKEVIEDLYIRWAFRGQKAPLCRMFGVKAAHFKAHLEATGLGRKRVQNTYDWMAALVDMKMEQLDPSEISVPELVKLIKHIDVREGRVVHRVRDERPDVIPVAASPTPGMQPVPSQDDVLEEIPLVDVN